MTAILTVHGRLTKDPVLRFSQGKGLAIATMRVAINAKEKDRQSGEMVDAPPAFYNIVAFGDQAEMCCEELTQGTMVLAYGPLKERLWTDKEGTEHRDHEIIAEVVAKSLKNKPRTGGARGDQQDRPRWQPSSRQSVPDYSDQAPF